MWRCVSGSARKGWGIRRLSSALRRHVVDEGDWSFSSEWWDPASDGHTIFRKLSSHGNGIVSVAAYPASTPSVDQCLMTEKWLQHRYAGVHPDLNDKDCQFKVLGYQWRVLKFNDDTRQSTVKVMAACRPSDPGSLILMQQSHCLAVPYVKSMVSVGLTALATSSFDLLHAVLGKKSMNILCIGHGGGTIPLFLASKIKGANVHVVEIDPVVVEASVEAMGFPSFEKTQQFVWDETLKNRISIHVSDVYDYIKKDSNIYDIVFVDAYDGDDIFPCKLWDINGDFLPHLANRVHPVHGTVVVNLHSDSDVPARGDGDDNSLFFQSVLPLGKYVRKVCSAYKGHFGEAFTVAVPWLCNITLVACKGKIFNRRDIVSCQLASKTNLVESLLNLKFSCIDYFKNGLMVVK
ncbi:hypothetical protein LUZ61_010086 [Rhynchospora tenuis]|uniref:Uncharacterized protein n=1 Tax=Rhynchospora tenuis TaxID=198213 RepID=A0AAD5ZYE9_9POAL|nr:hypothetical protein LUZ61_010086 [Rhynchospora tenuis]